MKRLRTNRRGMTLLKGLLAAALFSGTILALLGLIPQVKHSIAVAGQYRQAVLLVENQMELLQTMNLGSLAGEGHQGLSRAVGSLENLPLGSGFYSVEEDPAGYKVHIEVVWSVDRGTHRYEADTLISNRT